MQSDFDASRFGGRVASNSCTHLNNRLDPRRQQVVPQLDHGRARSVPAAVDELIDQKRQKNPLGTPRDWPAAQRVVPCDGERRKHRLVVIHNLAIAFGAPSVAEPNDIVLLPRLCESERQLHLRQTKQVRSMMSQQARTQKLAHHGLIADECIEASKLDLLPKALREAIQRGSLDFEC